LALVAVPGTSLLSLLRLLSDERYRAAILRKVDDPVVRAFWIDEFGNWNDRYRTEALAPIQNKVGQFLSNPILRAITGQARSTIDLRRVMDEGRVLIANLSKGRTGEDASGLLGALLVTGIQQAAMGSLKRRLPDSRLRVRPRAVAGNFSPVSRVKVGKTGATVFFSSTGESGTEEASERWLRTEPTDGCPRPNLPRGRTGKPPATRIFIACTGSAPCGDSRGFPCARRLVIWGRMSGTSAARRTSRTTSD